MSYFKQKGDHYVIMTSLGLVFSLGMVFLIIGIILAKALGFFWPGDLIEIRLNNEKSYLGEVRATQTVYLTDETGTEHREDRIQLKIGNRDIYGHDFVWLKEKNIEAKHYPEFATVFERWENGNFYGFIRKLHIGKKVISVDQKPLFKEARKAHNVAASHKEKIENLESEMNELIRPLTELRRELSLLKISEEAETAEGQAKRERLQKKVTKIQEQITPEYRDLLQQISALKQENQNIFLEVEIASSQVKEVPLANVVRMYQPNRMGVLAKSLHYAAKIWEFVSAKPRESNTEGGVFPAIFGTVMMVLLMSIAVVPFGVLAAIYLNEYARQGTVVRLIRLSVNNLAGVPSIVFGIFGLGFFIYIIGGTIDQIFFSQKLPEPTFGTGGILWASLTLALLALPVVVVATEEGILAVPRANKEGALALGATRWQMVRKIVLPNAMPGILTGLILAISRGAGEVAPLMITGVVKLAPSLPVDGTFPFFHLDRKFMHLGFHIYDVGFQSPNVEAAKPMVYTTALLLIFIVVALNLLAIYIRNRLRKKYKTSAF